MKFDFAKVTSVYSGRHGCACGCRGKHSYSAAFVAAHPDGKRGYKVTPDEVNDKTVKMMFNKVQAHFDQFPDAAAAEKAGCFVADDFASFDTDTRTYCVYFHGV